MSTDHDARLAFEALVRRFEAMADVREKHALAKRMGRSGYAEIAAAEAAAQAYRRCAAEVRLVIGGETPPPPNDRWEQPPLTPDEIDGIGV
jgi:hypothetical protein